MDKLFEKLSELFDQELERQENILAVCQAQRNAARAHDLEYLEAKTAALVILIREGAQAEVERHELLRRIVAHYALPVERQTLTDLIHVAPEPWRSRFHEFQFRLRATLARTRSLVRDSAHSMRRSLSIVRQALGHLETCVDDAGAYDASGSDRPRSTRVLSLIDAKG